MSYEQKLLDSYLKGHLGSNVCAVAFFWRPGQVITKAAPKKIMNLKKITLLN